MIWTQKEAIRLRSVQWLASQFHKLCGHQLGKHWFKHFEAWLWSSREHDDVEDAILSDDKDACYDIDLGNKLLKSKESPHRVASICEQLGIAHQAAKERVNSKKRYKNSPIEVEKMEEREKYVLSCGKTSVEITVRHYEKLRARYSALQGGHHKTGGYQASLHERCFDVLRDEFECNVECFASPFNCNMDQYCSKFGDELDSYFGSIGSFFRFYPKHGCFEANPPFSEKLVLKMYYHMERLLKSADETSNPLCFIVIIPRWSERESWNTLNQSKWCIKTVHLSQSDHGFCEGAQHLRDHTRRYRQSNHDTSIFFLQSKRGAEKWIVNDSKLDRLCAAFRPMNAQSHLVVEKKKRKREEDTTVSNVVVSSSSLVGLVKKKKNSNISPGGEKKKKHKKKKKRCR